MSYRVWTGQSSAGHTRDVIRRLLTSLEPPTAHTPRLLVLTTTLFIIMSSKPESMSYEHTTTFSTDVLAKAAALKVVDQKGNAVTFGSLFETQRVIVVFVRTSSQNPIHTVLFCVAHAATGRYTH
jgi:hypothetical protein